MLSNLKDSRIAVIGLGYVGLPLAIEFSKKYKVLGFDINIRRIKSLAEGNDYTNEVDLNELRHALKSSHTESANGFILSSDKDQLGSFNVFIVTVPTPIDRFKTPDLTHLITASTMLGSILKVGDLVIYESTVYPGCTEEECIPILEKYSGLKINKDFFVGYSPERINPGDKVNTLTKIIKVTSGSNDSASEFVDELYKSIITAGTFRVRNLKTAEASKAIENAQRDLNISFANELAIIFDKIGIDTNDVIDAAMTKWNFMNFRPGLVGGHCIGVDPYYLSHKAQSLGYYPEVILSGRRVNDGMAAFVVNKVIKMMINKSHVVSGSNVLILGFTFKENCPDIRNTKVVDMVTEFTQFGCLVDIYDPLANADEVYSLYKIKLISSIILKYDAVLLAVGHSEFRNLDFKALTKSPDAIIFDTKSIIDRKIVNGRI